jgi:hypothetical protein
MGRRMSALRRVLFAAAATHLFMTLPACSRAAGGAGVPTPGRSADPLAVLERVELGDPWAAPARNADDGEGAGALRAAPALRSSHVTTRDAAEAAPGTFRTPSDIAVPHITLRTNDGSQFAGSLAAAGDILAFGWGDRVLASPNGKEGGLFYLDTSEMWGSNVENGVRVVDVRASEVRASLGVCAPLCILPPAPLHPM